MGASIRVMTWLVVMVPAVLFLVLMVVIGETSNQLNEKVPGRTSRATLTTTAMCP